MSALPGNFTAQIGTTFGDAGRDWLTQLPALLADCTKRWGLTLAPHFTNLSFNYVAPATLGNGTPVVLKLGVPGYELWSEIDALKLYAGDGAVRLLDSDEALGALLLERLLPGTMLATLSDDEEATVIAARTMRQIWCPIPAEHRFQTVAAWFSQLPELREAFGGDIGPFPAKLVEEAETLAAELFRTAATPVVLHGDLHYFNVLAATRQPWLAIDPKGIIGEPAYEVGAWMRNWPPDLVEPLPLLERRLTIFAAELGIDRARLRAWTVAHSVLSTWWEYDDDTGRIEPQAIARLACVARLRD